MLTEDSSIPRRAAPLTFAGREGTSPSSTGRVGQFLITVEFAIQVPRKGGSMLQFLGFKRPRYPGGLSAYLSRLYYAWLP